LKKVCPHCKSELPTSHWDDPDGGYCINCQAELLPWEFRRVGVNIPERLYLWTPSWVRNLLSIALFVVGIEMLYPIGVFFRTYVDYCVALWILTPLSVYIFRVRGGSKLVTVLGAKVTRIVSTWYTGITSFMLFGGMSGCEPHFSYQYDSPVWSVLCAVYQRGSLTVDFPLWLLSWSILALFVAVPASTYSQGSRLVHACEEAYRDNYSGSDTD